MRWLLAAAAVLVAGSLAGPAEALTRPQADAIALKTLAPQRLSGDVVLFGLPRAVKATQSVALASARRQGLQAGPKIRAAGRTVWVYWLDLAYGARFEHPGRLLLVDDATGVASRPRSTRWYPLIDGRRPAYLRSLRAYRDARYWVYTSFKRPKRSARTTFAAARPSALPAQLPAGAFADDCLLMYGAYHDPLMARDFIDLRQFARGVGLRTFFTAQGDSGVSSTRPARGAPPSGSDLERGVDELADRRNCKDIFLYLSGHGAKSGPVSVSAGDGAWVFPINLRGAIADHPRVTFKVKIDSCYAGRFLADERLRALPNVLVIEAAASATEAAYGTLPPILLKNSAGEEIERVVDNPGRGEFTHANITGMQAFARSRAEITLAQRAGGSLLARMLTRSFAIGAGSDAARLTGRTHPVIRTNLDFRVPPQPEPPPVALPLSAEASHTHPSPNPGFSYICDKVTSSAGATLRLSVSGPLNYAEEETTTLPSGTGLMSHTFSFKITAIGSYTLAVSATKGSQTAKLELTYEVPALSTAAGPFGCPPP